MYERGLGVKQDDFKAVNWYRKAAEQDDVLEFVLNLRGRLSGETNGFG